MNSPCGWCRTALLLWLILPGSLRAQTSWAAEADFNSRYLWRGIAYSKGPVFQPAFWITHRQTTVSIWSNMVLNNEPRRGRFDQLFFSVAHEFALGRWRLEPSFQGYTWQGLRGETTANTLELAAKLSRPLGPVRLVIAQTLDVAGFRGAFIADAGVEWKRPAGRWQLESSATAAWANATFHRTYTGAERAAMNHGQLTFSATRKSANGWYIRPHAEFVTILSDPVRTALGNRVLANAGMAVGREF